jgi:hypothetical protein
MAASTLNWVFGSGVVLEKDRATLEKAKRIENKNLKKGYRWIKINERNKIFVPCDKKGNPTKEGLHKINMLKLSLGIK